MRQHSRDAFFMQVRREQFRQRGGDGLERGLVADEMHIGVDRKARRRQDAFGGFHIGAVEPEPFGQLQPALDAAFGAEIAVMVLDPVPPFEPDAAVAEARDHHGVLDRNRALVIIAVQRPGLHLSLVQLAAVQQPVKRMQIVIARRADLAQRRFQFLGAVQRRACPSEKAVIPFKVIWRSKRNLRSIGGNLPARALGDLALGGVAQQHRVGIVDMQKYLPADIETGKACDRAAIA